MNRVFFNDRVGLTEKVIEGLVTIYIEKANLTDVQVDIIEGRTGKYPPDIVKSIKARMKGPKFKVGERVALMDGYTLKYNRCMKAVEARYAILITGSRLCKLNAVTDDEWLRMGVVKHENSRRTYYTVWEKEFGCLSAARGYLGNSLLKRKVAEQNPYVWVYEFKLEEMNEEDRQTDATGVNGNGINECL